MAKDYSNSALQQLQDDTPTVVVTAPAPDVTSAIPDYTKKATEQLTPDPTPPPPPPPPPAPVPTAQQLLDAKLGVTGIRNALAIAPDEYRYGGLGAFLPVREDAQGKHHFAIPQAFKSLGNGLLDLVEGPITGTVSQDARGALMTAALQGRNRMFGEAGTPLPASSFTANPVRAGALDQSVLGSGGFKPSMIGDSMPVPTANMMSPATTAFVDWLYHTAGSAAGGAVGEAVNHLVGGIPGIGFGAGAAAGAAVHQQTAALLQSLLPEQRAAVIANATARYGADAVRRMGLTMLSPGATPDSDSAKLPPMTMQQPSQGPLYTGGGNGQY